MFLTKCEPECTAKKSCNRNESKSLDHQVLGIIKDTPIEYNYQMGQSRCYKDCTHMNVIIFCCYINLRRGMVVNSRFTKSDGNTINSVVHCEMPNVDTLV